MHGLPLLSLSTLVLAWPAIPAGGDAHFQHHDWLLVCDNTLTCRAAGYSPDDATRPVSVLLTRQAGPDQPVKAEVQIGVPLDADTPPAAAVFPLALRIDDRALGEVSRDAEAGPSGTLSPAQVAALLDALRRDSRIVWTSPEETHYVLSDRGASAVLLKMDEVQGRVGTSGALVRPGPHDESQVPTPRPVPVIHVPGTDDAAVTLTASERAALARALQAQPDRRDCPALYPDEGPIDPDQIEVIGLSSGRHLVSARCWRAVYNEGIAYWVVDARPPYRPALVTTDGSLYAHGRIEGVHKGRGRGDCWDLREWVWDGEAFVGGDASTTGLCREFPGGAWTLPIRISDVRMGEPPARSAE